MKCSASASAATGCSSSCICGVLTLVLQLILAKTRFGSQLRAAVDDPRVARGLGINVGAVFALTFAFGSGLAGLGGALGAEILGLDPTFPLKFMIYFLIVVTVGGTSSITGAVPCLAAARHRRRRRQILRAEARRLRHLHAHDRRADLAAAGPVRAADGDDGRRCKPPHIGVADGSRAMRWRSPEIAFWLVAAATLFLLAGPLSDPHRDRLLGLFALSLDLILGYAGIVSLGHAAFFGFGAYAAGIAGASTASSPSRCWPRRRRRSPPPSLGFVTSFLVLRGSDLTRLMVTLGVALVLRELANRYSGSPAAPTACRASSWSRCSACSSSISSAQVAYVYSLVVLFVLFVLARRIVNSPFGLSLRAIRDNPLRAAAVGIPVNRRLVAVYTLAAGLCRHRRRAARRRPRSSPRSTCFSFDRSADRAAGADHRRHRLSLWRADRRRRLQAGAGLSRRR